MNIVFVSCTSLKVYYDNTCVCVCTSITHYVQKMRYIQYILLYSAVRKHFTLSNSISKCTCLLLMWFCISYLCSCLTQSHKVNFVFVIKKFFPLCDYLEIIICLVPSSKLCLVSSKGFNMDEIYCTKQMTIYEVEELENCESSQREYQLSV